MLVLLPAGWLALRGLFGRASSAKSGSGPARASRRPHRLDSPSWPTRSRRLVAELVWSDGLRFDATSRANTALVVDGDGKAGPSPMQYAAMAICGLHGGLTSSTSLRKGRHPMSALRVTFTGTRAETPPRPFSTSPCTSPLRARCLQTLPSHGRSHSRATALLGVALVPAGHRTHHHVRHPPVNRRGYLDWLRGIAVLIMIQAHTLDAWTRCRRAAGRYFAWAMIVGGFGAPMFLFLAGIALALAAGSQARRSSDAAARPRAAMRGWQIFGLAFLFRLQSWFIGGGVRERCSRSTSSTSWGCRC